MHRRKRINNNKNQSDKLKFSARGYPRTLTEIQTIKAISTPRQDILKQRLKVKMNCISFLNNIQQHTSDEHKPK